MNKKFMAETAHGRAYAAWFSNYEAERKRRRRRRGARLADFPEAPPGPEDVREAVGTIGAHVVLNIFGIHRTTLGRWLTGAAQIPRPAWLLLRLMHEGRLPGMSSDWRHMRFDGDRLHIIGTRHSYSALEIAGWHYQQDHISALSRRIVELEQQITYLHSVGDFDAANDPMLSVR